MAKPQSHFLLVPWLPSTASRFRVTRTRYVPFLGINIPLDQRIRSSLKKKARSETGDRASKEPIKYCFKVAVLDGEVPQSLRLHAVPDGEVLQSLPLHGLGYGKSKQPTISQV